MNDLGASALLGLTKATRALAYYPSEHPALEETLASVHAPFQQLTAEGPWALDVSKEGFSQGERPFGNDLSALRDLARALVSRRVKRLTVHPGIAQRELFELAQVLLLSPEEVYHQGGIHQCLSERQVLHISTDADDFQAQQKPASSPPVTASEQPSKPTDRRTLNELLKRLRKTPSEHWPAQMATLEKMAAPLVRAEPLKIGVSLCGFLLSYVEHPKVLAEWRRPVEDCLQRLASAPVVDALIDVCLNNAPTEENESSRLRLLHYLTPSHLNQLLSRWPDSPNTTQDQLLDLLTPWNDEVLDLLENRVDTEVPPDIPWIELTGRLQNPRATPWLSPLLHSTEVDVQQEALRALTRIGGEEIADILIELVHSGAASQRLAAITALGPLQSPKALPLLLQIVRRFDWFGRHRNEKRAALLALGRQNSSEAVSTLTRTVLRRWGRNQEPLKLAAINALIHVKGSEVDHCLAKAVTDRSDAVRKAAHHAQMLRQGKR